MPVAVALFVGVVVLATVLIGHFFLGDGHLAAFLCLRSRGRYFDLAEQP